MSAKYWALRKSEKSAFSHQLSVLLRIRRIKLTSQRDPVAILGLRLPLALGVFNGEDAKVRLLVAVLERDRKGVLVLVGAVLLLHHLRLSHDRLDGVALVVVELLKLGPNYQSHVSLPTPIATGHGI